MESLKNYRKLRLKTEFISIFAPKQDGFAADMANATSKKYLILIKFGILPLFLTNRVDFFLK